MSLSTEIERDGFAVIPDVFPAQQMDELLEEMNRQKPHRSRAGVRHALRIPAVHRFAKNSCLTQLAQRVLGPEAFPFRATLFDKSAESNWLIVWHQDTALPLQERREISGWSAWSIKDGINYAHAPASVLQNVIALRVHLNDSNAENGPLRILPGTHQSGIMNDDQIHAYSTRIAAADCTVKKGGVLAMRPLLIHASSKCQTNLPRRVLHIEYAASESIAAPVKLAIA